MPSLSKKPVPIARQKKIRDFLKANGHDKDKVDRLNLADDGELAAAVLAIHGVSEAEYRGAGGKG